jgi:hypothetical protein
MELYLKGVAAGVTEVMQVVYSYTRKYLGLIRSSAAAPPFDAGAKKQLMYIYRGVLSGDVKIVEYTKPHSGDRVFDHDLALPMITADDAVVDKATLALTMFIKKIANAVANLCWRESVRITADLMNSILRQIDTRSTNPELFTRAFGQTMQ